MSLVEQMHAAHKARLVRMNGSKPDQPVIKDNGADLLAAHLRREIACLREEVKRQAGVIADQQSYIERLAGVAADTNPKLDEIFNCCCKYYDVSPADMRSPSKALGLPFRRQTFYFLGREYGHSLHQIGRHIHKDHSSVVYGARKISELLQDDVQLRGDIDILRQKILARAYERRRALEELVERAA
jgi:chromosomal replication initiation ATPase DnaA